jgi:hypothetical protein
VKFKKAVEDTVEIKDAWRAGLQSLRSVDKDHITSEDSRRLAGSVNVDETLMEKYPNESRWDYAIGHQPANSKAEMVYWIEIHPARDGEVKVVLAKLQWLKKWLSEKSPKLNAMRREFIWLSSGRTSFTLSSPQQKRLAVQGLQHKGRVFKIPNNAGG